MKEVYYNSFIKLVLIKMRKQRLHIYSHVLVLVILL